MAYQGSIDWGASISRRWRLAVVDVATWADGGVVDGAMSVSVSRDRDGSLVESGSATVAMPIGEQPVEFVGRIEMLADGGTAVERHPIATLRFVPGRSVIHSGRRMVDYDGYSVLRPAETRKMLAGTYVPKGADGAEWVAGMLEECMKAPVHTGGSFALAEHYSYDGGTPYIDAIWELLDKVGWCLRIDERGEVTVMPLPKDPALVLDRANAKLLDPELESDDGLADVPNRWIVVDGDAVAMSVDESDLPSSYPSRGYYVDEYEESPTRLEGETLQDYADRKRDEAISTAGTRTYTRVWVPDVLPFDIVRGSIADVGLDCDMRVKSQSLELGKVSMVTEVSEVLR